MLAWISRPSWPSILSNSYHRKNFPFFTHSLFANFSSVTSIYSHFSNMSQSALQDPVDLVQVNSPGHDTTNTERMPSPTPMSTQEDPPTSYQAQAVAHEPLGDSSTQPRSASPPALSSKTEIPSEAPTNTHAIPNGQNTQIDQTQLPQEDLGSSKDPLEAYDWAELEERFHAEMEKCANREDGIQKEFDEPLKVNFLLSTSYPARFTSRGVIMTSLYILTDIRSSKHGQPPAPCTKRGGRESGMLTPLCSKFFTHRCGTANNPKTTNPHGLCAAKRDDHGGEEDAL